MFDHHHDNNDDDHNTAAYDYNVAMSHEQVAIKATLFDTCVSNTWGNKLLMCPF